MAVPTTIFPGVERFVDIAREATPGTIPSSPGSTLPLMTFNPSDKPMWLKNQAWYGDMAATHGVQQGPLIGGFDAGGPYFGDMIGHAIYNMLGDYTVTGTAASPSGTSSAPIAAGATSITVASGGASFAAGMNLWIEDGGTPALNEVVTVTTGSTSTNIPLSTPTRFAHLTATPFTNTAAGPFTHTFALLNSNSNPGTGNGAGQPPTHTWTDRTGIPATGLAAQYSYTCFTELQFTGSAEQFVMWEGKALCNVRSIAGTPLSAPSISAVQPIPSWRSTVSLTPVGGGVLTQVKDIGEWQFTLTRDGMKPIFTNQGSQQIYVLPRGKLSSTGKLEFTPAIDETPLLQLLANGQPQIQMVCSNGLSGANLVSIQIDVGLAAYETSDLQDGDELFGWSVPFEAVAPPVASTTFNGVSMQGASGGSGPIKITLQNAVASYAA